jgi:hypothetical protein
VEQSGPERKSWQQIISRTLITVFGKIGCLTFIIAAGSALLGWWIDRLLGTQPWLMIILFIASVPISMIVIYFVVKTSMPLTSNQNQQRAKSEEERFSDKESS